MYALQRVLARGRLWGALVTLAICLLAGAALGALVALLTPVYAVALLIGLGGGLLMLRSRQFTLFVIVAILYLLPFGSLPLNIGFSPTFLNLALGVYFLVWMVRVATGRQESWASSPLSAVVLVFLLLTLMTFVSGLSHAQLTATALRKFAEIPLGIALFFAVLNNVRSQRDLTMVTRWLILGGTAAAVLGIVLYVIPQPLATRLLSALRVFRYPSGPGVLRFVEDNPQLPMRAIATSVDPNVLGAVLILTIGLGAPHLFAAEPVFRRRWLVLCLGLMGICLLLTYSRGSMAGLGAALLFLGLFPRYRKALAVMLLAGALLLLLPQTQSYVAHFAEGLAGQDRATQMRFGEYKDALILIGRYPWLGVGFVDTPDIDLYLGVSNLYLLIAEEMGLIGLGVFLVCMAIFFLMLFDARQRSRASPQLEPWLLGPAVAVAAGLAGALFDHTLFSFSHALTLFWLIIGLGAVAARGAVAEAAGSLDRARSLGPGVHGGPGTSPV